MNHDINIAARPAQDSAIRAALRIAADLAEARAGLAEIIATEAHHEANLAYVKAKTQQVIIEAAGGEKAFGANEDERKRKLICELETREGYAHVRDLLIETQSERRLAEADCELLQHQIQILLASISADVLHLPADWLRLPGEGAGARAVAAVGVISSE